MNGKINIDAISFTCSPRCVCWCFSNIRWIHPKALCMMTSSNGHTYSVTGLWARDSLVDRWQVNSPHKRPVTRIFHVFFDLRLNLQLSKQWRRRWFETPWRSLWRHCNVWWSRSSTSYEWDGHLTHCGLVTPYGIIKISQHWYKSWRGLLPGQCQAVI